MSPKHRYQPLLETPPAPHSRTDLSGTYGGISWLRLSLPFDLTHINLWLLGDGETLVDTGFDTPETRDFLSKLCTARKPENIFITHFHPDHLGLAGWLQRKTGASVTMAAREHELAQLLFNPAWIDSMVPLHNEFYRAAGASNEMSAMLLGRNRIYARVVTSLPDVSRRIADGETIQLGGRTWQMIEGNGHSPEHACLYNKDDEILIAGDIVLSDITPNISLFPRDGSDANPVADYLACLERIKNSVSNQALVLPSHGVAFFGLHDRVDALIKHHQRRGEKIMSILGKAGGATALEVMRHLFAHRKLEDSDIAFALGETLSHLVWLEKKSAISCSQESDGVRYFSTR